MNYKVSSYSDVIVDVDADSFRYVEGYVEFLNQAEQVVASFSRDAFVYFKVITEE